MHAPSVSRLITSGTVLVIALLAAGCGLLSDGTGEQGVGARPPGTASATPTEVTVERVVDGDTFIARVGGERERIRVIGIDTPELHVVDGGPADCWGKRSAATTTDWIDGHRVRLTAQSEPRDRYERLLRDVRMVDGPKAGADLATELVRAGHARTLTIAPNDWNSERLQRLERAARTAGRGLWGACSAQRK